MMAMLIRAGLPSRRAAMAAIEKTEPDFNTPAQMRDWLASDEIATLSCADNWPTPDTGALWARFRTEALNGVIPNWSITRYRRRLDSDVSPSSGIYRILTESPDGRTWLATPDFQQIATFKKPAIDPKPSLFWGRVRGESGFVEALRLGTGILSWPPSDTE
jgi:hypothetical protein